MMPWREIKARTVARLARTRFGRDAMAETTSLSSLFVKPTPRVCVGLGLMGLSYIIGWPAVGLLALIAFHTGEPIILAIGGPLVYGLSHLVFMAGFYLAGSHYAPSFLRWITRKAIEKMGGCPSDGPPVCHKGVFSPAHGVGLAAFLLSGGLLFFRSEIAALPLGIFVLSCLLAPFFPRAGFFLPVISRGRAPGRAVALTFDDGPDQDVIRLLLDLLQRHGAPATFFVMGKKAEGNPELIREILLRGHAVGNHSYRHDPLLMLRSSARLSEEITRTQQLLADFGIRPLAFRPPVGITNPRLPRILKELHLDCVTFSCRACDFGNRRIANLAKIILRNIRPGAIVLLHDVSPPGIGTVQDWLQQVEWVIRGLKSQGYKIVPLSVLIGREVMETLP